MTLLGAAYIVFLLAFAEGLSWSGASILRGEPVAYSRLSEERRAIQGADPLDVTRDAHLAISTDEVIHPYFGVGYPVTKRRSQRPFGDESLADYGFKEDAGPFIRERTPDRFIINITGGSVARGFIDWGGQDVLREELEKHPAFADKEIVFSSTAFYGHKEPQQLLAIQYLLTMGATFDLIVAVDGFNELALGKVYNEGTGASPFYPWGWYGRLWTAAPDAEQLLLRGEIAHLRKSREEWAALFDRMPLGGSLTAGLIWNVIDQRKEAEIREKTFRLTTQQPPWQDAVDSGPVPPYPDEDAYLRDQASVWEQGTRQLARLAQGNNIGFLSVLQPNQYAGAHVMSDDERQAAWREDLFKPLVEKGYPLLREAALRLQAEGVAFHDATDVFDGTGEVIYTDDCCHFNAPLGNEILARRLAEAIGTLY